MGVDQQHIHPLLEEWQIGLICMNCWSSTVSHSGILLLGIEGLALQMDWGDCNPIDYAVGHTDGLPNSSATDSYIPNQSERKTTPLDEAGPPSCS